MVLSLVLTLRVKRSLTLQAFKPNRQQESDKAQPQTEEKSELLVSVF